ncbi:hypothetical protein N7475_004267 [Penicillium sp. IBT 31633x]|nr:hypothetical protein N7475_004267 [Penicillium sp. IBT 31633x]
MERSLALRTREPAPSSSNQSDPIAPQETEETEEIVSILSPKPFEMHDVVVSATSIHNPAIKGSVSVPFADKAVVSSTPGQKRKASMPAESTATPKRAKKTVSTTKSPEVIFPPPVPAIAKHGPVYDSNWYRSVLEEPLLLGYRTASPEAVFEAYESLLMNQTRIEYDLRKLTGFLFGSREILQSTPEDEDAGLDEEESSDMGY